MSADAAKTQATGQAVGCLVVLALFGWMFYEIRTCGEGEEVREEVKVHEPTAAELERAEPLPWEKTDHSGEAYALNRQFVRALRGGTIFGPVDRSREARGIVRVDVGPGFFIVPRYAQIRYAGALYSYYFDGSDPKARVDLYDAFHQKVVGTFGRATNGLRMTP